jgi:hypothetical protein
VLEKFFAGSPKYMRLFFLGFVVAAIGVALGLSIDYRPGNPFAYVAFGTVVIGCAIGAIVVAWGWFSVAQYWVRRWRSR